MRVALSVSVLVGLALIIFVAFLVAKRAQKRRKELVRLTNKVGKLQIVLLNVTDEVKLQEQAGYSDVVPFRNILNGSKEYLP